MARRTANEEFFDAMVRHQIGLLRVAGGMRQKIFALLDATEQDIRRAIRDRLRHYKGRTPTDVKRLKALVQEIGAIRGKAWNKVGEAWTDDMKALAVYEPKFIDAAIKTHLPVEVETRLPSAAKLKAIVTSHPFQGRALKGWAKNIQAADLSRIDAQIKIGLVQGEAMEQIARRIVGTVSLKGLNGVTQITRSNAESITLTAVNAISNKAATDYFLENPDLVTVEIFTAVLDAATTPICVVGSTLVRPVGLVHKIYRRRYRGDVLVVRTASGKKLAGTPNHPVLTANGWLPLQELKPGQQVFNASTLQSGGVHGGDDVSVPTSAAQLFDAANDPAFADVFRKGSTAADFHNDGVGSDGDVDVLVAKCPLRLTAHLRQLELREHEPLCSVHRSAGFESSSLPDFLRRRRVPRYVSAQVCAVPGEQSVDASLRALEPARDLRGLKFLRVKKPEHFDSVLRDALVSLPALERWHDASLLEQVRHRGRRDVVLPSDRTGGLPVSVAPDDVVSVRREFRTCHVYNFDTGPGVYIANGVVVHNCRSKDGDRYPVAKGPQPPLHFRCRSRRIALLDAEPIGERPMKPVTERMLLREFTKREGLDSVTKRGDLPTGTRGKFDAFAKKRTRELIGRVPSKVNYQEFLKRQSHDFQQDVLGKTRARLFRDGGVTLKRFVNRAGDELTIPELAKKEAAAFRRAGLDPDDFIR